MVPIDKKIVRNIRNEHHESEEDEKEIATRMLINSYLSILFYVVTENFTESSYIVSG